VDPEFLVATPSYPVPPAGGKQEMEPLPLSPAGEKPEVDSWWAIDLG
jgi:hypothetical protein